MPEKKKYWFSGLFEPVPASAFVITTPATQYPEYACGKFPVAPCTLALAMRNCAGCNGGQHV